MTKTLLFAFLAVPSLCSAALAENVTVFAASSLTDAFGELGKAFDAKTGHTTSFQFAGSQVLRTQLENGARADVFASANTAQFGPLVKSGMLNAGEIFARNRLVIITPRGASKVKTLKDLARPGVKIVFAAANVPVGSYTRQVLDTMSQDRAYGADFARRVLANAVSEEPNVRQVGLKVQLGEADAAFVYTTDVTPTLRAAVTTIGVPTRFNPPIAYPIGTTRNASAAARAFVSFVTSGEGQRILRKWGFLAP
ncbi:molybdate ABC transporter substrate-binding protein [Deinococcus yavapaiensis]|uniref:Molybdate transport system substrate-binding protein n=1 Tax=Deinococcus yavapaiensis KR-236 TaxID=694435 RepID=A0A318S3Q5_9DEIO|nr:molybdate ABC transporter substrate-binding protein [Deinococcus yavapaiensis]PYE49395.1 molybdate transport system substrate-binding protein [Deinococcus yavapaiensis KR-236]